MKPLIVLAVLASIGPPATALAGPHTEKIYAANGRRIGVIKYTNHGRKVYAQDGRRVAVIRNR